MRRRSLFYESLFTGPTHTELARIRKQERIEYAFMRLVYDMCRSGHEPTVEEAHALYEQAKRETE